MKLAYIVPRFPTVTETFVLNEILALQSQGVDIELYPLIKGRMRVLHPQARGLVQRAHFVPIFSVGVLIANVRALLRNPFAYLKVFFEVLLGTRKRMDYFAGTILIFSKCVKFAEDMRRSEVTHIHAHFGHHPTTAALVVHRLTGIPFSFTVHGHDLHINPQMIERKAAAAQFVVTISEYNKALLIERCGTAVERKIHVIHCGVEPALFSPREAAPNREFIISCIGSLREVKGHAYLIEACRILRERGVEFRCKVVGEGEERGAIEKRIREYGLDGHVRLYGARTQGEVARILRGSDVCVQPSVRAKSGSREGIPVVLMEAMASGLPTVTSKLSGIPELVQDGVTGILVAERDAAALASAIERLANNSDLRSRMGRAGRQKVMREFNLESCAGKLKALFENAERVSLRHCQSRQCEWTSEVLVSVVIPVRNEEGYIGRCLDTILNSDLCPEQYEIIVVDGVSTDRTRQIVADRAERFLHLRLLENPARVVPTAMNIGIRGARGRYIIRLDAHAEYPPDYLRLCVEELERTGAANAGGRCVNRPGADSLSANVVSLVSQHRFGVGAAAFRIGLGDRWVDTVPFGAFRRELFGSVGLYDERLVRHQDFELNARIRHAGGKLYLSSKISSVYFGRTTMKDFCRQGYRNGVWNGRAWIWHPYTFCPRRALPLAFVSVELLSLCLGLLAHMMLWVGLAGLIAYTVAASAASLQLARRHGYKYLPVLPFCFFGFHFAFGSGLLSGLLTTPFVAESFQSNAQPAPIQDAREVSSDAARAA